MTDSTKFGGLAFVVPGVSQTVGLVFLISGAFKLIQLTRQLGLAGFLPSFFEYAILLISVLEIIFAGLLWSSPKSRFLNSAGILVMSLLSAYELKMVFEGVKSCGCFGAWETRPLFVLFLCIAIVALLFLVRSECSNTEVFIRLSGLFLPLVVVIVLAIDGFLSLSTRIITRLHPDSPISVAMYGQLKTGRDSKTVEFEIAVRNDSNSNVSVVGSPFQCGVRLEDQTPFELEPHRTKKIRFTIKKPDNVSWLKLPVKLFIEDHGTKQLWFDAYGSMHMQLSDFSTK